MKEKAFFFNSVFKLFKWNFINLLYFSVKILNYCTLSQFQFWQNLWFFWRQIFFTWNHGCVKFRTFRRSNALKCKFSSTTQRFVVISLRKNFTNLLGSQMFPRLSDYGAPLMKNRFWVAKFWFEVKKASSLFCLV